MWRHRNILILMLQSKFNAMLQITAWGVYYFKKTDQFIMLQERYLTQKKYAPIEKEALAI